MPNREEEDRDLGSTPPTMEHNYSAAIDKVSGIGALEAAVEERKRVVSSQNAELKALEERLRATEQRLREKQSYSSSTYTRVGSEKLPGNLAHRNRQPISFSSVQLNSSTKHPAPSQPQSLGETNPTHRTGFMPGALPESPWSTTGSDYILVEGDSSAEWEDKT